MINIEIDGKKLQVEPGTMIIEAADDAGVVIPRFCYHKKLSIAANCRMCLVEVEKSRKPLPACATPVTEGMRVFTKSTMARDAQRSVMEFLLINHPLDCPICDQGGECELQDLSLTYGDDISRYSEGKRSVDDENIGTLVATEMTRCIHCTRCVRFGEEIAGVRELGAIGRGEHIEIATFVNQSLVSEVAGNIIDLCPVGALTSKPYRFTARAWELQETRSIAPHDCIGANIAVHSRRGQVMRVVPHENEAINETWATDRDRFSYCGLQSHERLSAPKVKQNGHWYEVSFTEAFEMAATKLKQTIKQYGAQSVAALISPSATTEEHYLWQKLFRALHCANIDHRLRQQDFQHDSLMPDFPGLSCSLTEVTKKQAIFLIGANVRKEQPLLSLRIRQAVMQGAQVHSISAYDYESNFDVTTRSISHPNAWHDQLLEIYAALLQEMKQLAPQKVAHLDDKILLKQAENVAVSEQTHLLCKSLLNKSAIFLLGASALQHQRAGQLIAIVRSIAMLLNADVGLLTDGANSAGAWIVGALPHRQAHGESLIDAGHDAKVMLTEAHQAYCLFQFEPEFDSPYGQQAIANLEQAECVIAFSSYASESLQQYADIIFPIAPFTENAGTYVNAIAHVQRFSAAVAPKDQARPGWKVLRVLGNFLGLEGFEYNSIDEVQTEIQPLMQEISKMPVNTLPHYVINHSEQKRMPLQRLIEWPIYSVDMLVRRAQPLQQAASQDRLCVKLHPDDAKQLGLTTAKLVAIIQSDIYIEMPLEVTTKIARGCVWIPAGHSATYKLLNQEFPIQLNAVDQQRLHTVRESQHVE